MDISFIVLNYKSAGLLKNCLKSIIDADLGFLKYEIIVVDNNSNDNIKEILQQNFTNIKFIQSPRNLGMGGGNNLGIKHAQGKYLAVLNPDTVVSQRGFTNLFNFMEQNSRVGIAGPQAINPDGKLQHTRCRFPNFLIPLYRRTPVQKLKFIRKKLDLYLTKDIDYSQPSRADWVYGVCLFMRKKAIERVGYFDELFFLGFEDTDLCRRMWQAGYEVWYYPYSKIIHYPHRFSGSNNWLTSLLNKNVRIHIGSWLKYFNKYRSFLIRT